MLKYNFGIYGNENPVTLQSYRIARLRVEEPYWMLSSVGDVINDPKFIDNDIIPNIRRVLNGEIENYDWGCDLALIYSHNEMSEIEYMYDSANGVQELRIDVPTEWLLELMVAWRDFLTQNKF